MLETYNRDAGKENVREFSADSNSPIGQIIEKVADLGFGAMARDYAHTNLVDTSRALSNKDYKELNTDVKQLVLNFMAEKCGYEGDIDSTKSVVRLFDKGSAQEIYNDIIVQALETIILGTEPAGLMRLANIDNIPVGDSKTYEIDAKGLPVVQRNSYTSNVTFLTSETKQALVVTPKVYSLGVQMEYIRLITGTFDFGRQIAKVAMAMLYAQYKLVVKVLFDSANLTGTPFYFANFEADRFVEIAEAITALNGGAPVVAYGTKTAFHKVSGIATKGMGFAIQDEFVKTGQIGTFYGIPQVVIDQSFDGSEILADDFKNLLVPNDYILLMSAVDDKPVKLVRENFVRALDKDPNDGTVYRRAYKYFMAFDVGLATQSNYGIMSTETV